MPRPAKEHPLAGRAAEKRAARLEDRVRLERGVSRKRLQRENSIFPAEFFAKARISNLRQAIGR